MPTIRPATQEEMARERGIKVVPLEVISREEFEKMPKILENRPKFRKISDK